MNQHTRLDTTPIPFIDVAAQRRRLGSAVDDAVARVLAHCQFVMGPEVQALEQDLAAFCGARHAISCASGTDALLLVLMAQGIGRGDAVFCPAFTFCATAEVVALLGATPVFVDIDETTFNLDVASLKRAIPVAKTEGLFVLDDAAQGFGATYKGRKLGAFAPATATSFFPAKPLGCFGDGGAVMTDDDELADIIRSLRVHGQGTDRYDNVRIGITGRLDTVQAAILLEKLKIFPDEIAARQHFADRYAAGLEGIAIVPAVPRGYTSVWAQYTIRLMPGARDRLAEKLKAEGIPTA